MEETNSFPSPSSERNTRSSKLVPAGAPNDGLPETWRPIEEPPIVAGAQGPQSAPRAGLQGPDPYFAASIPSGMQLEPDIMPTRYSGGLGAYRVMPPIASADPALNSAIQSLTGKS
jgi:hypothetical protein